jgi:hypothetical protein
MMLRAVVNMLILAAVACLFNFWPEKVGTYRTAADLTTFTPLLAPAFADHLLGLNLWWGLSFAFNVVLLRTRRWTPALRWAEMALGFIGAYVLARLVVEGPFLTAAGGALVRYLLTFVVLAMVFGSARKLNRLVNGRWLVYGSDPAGD